MNTLHKQGNLCKQKGIVNYKVSLAKFQFSALVLYSLKWIWQWFENIPPSSRHEYVYKVEVGQCVETGITTQEVVLTESLVRWMHIAAVKLSQSYKTYCGQDHALQCCMSLQTST